MRVLGKLWGQISAYAAGTVSFFIHRKTNNAIDSTPAEDLRLLSTVGRISN
jgi:hypothetical protein